MQKKFIKATALIIAAAMCITILVTFLLQTFSSLGDAKDQLDYMLNEIEVRLEENSISIKDLKESLSDDYLSRTRSFSYMVAQDPSILESEQELNEIMKRLDVDELHVIDEKGIIRWSTIPSYVGFDMASSEQTLPFIEILENPELEIAQEPQPNGTLGILFQYIGVARMDQPGFVQIGLQPTRLESALKNNEIGNILERYKNNEESVFAVNRTDMTVAWHPDEAKIGKKLSEIGLKDGVEPYLGNVSTVTIDGISYRILAREIEDYIIITQVGTSGIYAARNMQVLVLIISDLLVVIVLVWQINLRLKKQMIQPINSIAEKIKKIENGSLDTVVEIHTSPEFTLLSNGINAMVSSIHSKMEETKELLETQKNTSLKVGESAARLDGLSHVNLATANQIADGSTEQSSSMQELTNNISDLAHQMGKDSDQAAKASYISSEVGDTLLQGSEELHKLVETMQQIDAMAQEIKNVVKTIDEISFQTNLLALNAAIEAARAGESGRGFSVVADEIRVLAGKSAESAKQTAEMIGHTTEVMHSGKVIAEKTADTVQNVVAKAKQANNLTDDIAATAGNQTKIIENIRIYSEQVKSVIQNNSKLAEEGRVGVSELLDEIQMLHSLAHKTDDI